LRNVLCFLYIQEATQWFSGFFRAAFARHSNDASFGFHSPSSGISFDIPCILAAPVVKVLCVFRSRNSDIYYCRSFPS
jgi:hypothetical protein